MDKAILKSLGDHCQAVALTQNVRLRKEVDRMEQAGGSDLTRRVSKTVAGLQREPVQKTALAEASGVTGGYLVPPDVRLHLDTILEQQCPFFERGYVQPMTTETLNLPMVDIAAGNAAGTAVEYGGLKMTWGREAATLSETEPKFTSMNMVAKNLQGVVYCSNQLIWDGGEALGAYLMRLFELALVWQVNYAFLQGNGADQPLGVVNASGTVSITRKTSSQVVNQDIGWMAGSLIPACFSRSVWVVNPSTLKTIGQMANYVVNAWHYKESMAGLLMTRPVYVSDQLPAVGTKGDVVLFDPSMYAVCPRLLEISASDVPLFTTNQTVFRLIWRGDGQPMARNTVTLADGTTTAGIAVTLV